MIDEITADIIYMIHLFVLIFVIVAPFMSNQKILVIEMALLLAIMFHWITNNQVCCLTEVEKILRNKEHDTQTFFGNLIGPVYTFGKDSMMYQIALFTLIMITLYKVKPLEAFEVKKMSDLFIKWRTLYT